MTSASATRPPQIPGYQYVADIATGGYSVVYRYRQHSPRRDVAVKVLTGHEADVAPEQRDAEANVMAKLGNHPNIVQVIVADVTPDGQHYIIMPYYPGRSLAELVAEGAFTIGKVLRVGIQVAGALDAAHRFGLLHRDIKPANILIDEYGTPRLTDFGIAGWVGIEQQTDAGGLSLPWSPAEVIAGGESQRASDIYSLGALLFHLLVGHPPYAQPVDTREALEWRVQNTTAPATDRADVPAELEALLARMLARAPEHRPQSASLVASELRDIEAALGGPVPADAPWHRGTPGTAPSPRFAETSPRVVPDGPPATDPMPIFGRTTRPARPDEPARPANPMVRPAPLQTVRRSDGSAGPHRWEPVAEATQLRRAPAATDGDAAPAARRTPVSGWVLAAAGAAAFAVVIGGIVWSASGSTRPPSTPTAGASQNAVLDDLPPGVPTITARRSGVSITFHWTYDGAEATDTFLWRVSGSDHSTVARQTTVAIPDKRGTQLCIQVKVVRVSGNGTPDWSPEGCGS